MCTDRETGRGNHAPVFFAGKLCGLILKIRYRTYEDLTILL